MKSINETIFNGQNFNKYFTQTGPKLAKYTGTSTPIFDK